MSRSGRRVLFVTPEIAPLNKVGGLGDVGHGLVQALRREGCDARVLLPGFADVREHCSRTRPVAALGGAPGGDGHLLEARAAGLEAPLYLADLPRQFDQPGSPYGQWNGGGVEQARRFHAFAHAAARIGQGLLADWQPDVIHANDWTTGLVPALLHGFPVRPATVFTVHNLAHQGLYSREVFDALGLARELWTFDALEFHGRLSFIKGGLVYADRINTVSPTHAAEVVTTAFGCGLEGLLAHRRERLSGILNGVDYDGWDPARDPALASPFDAADPDGKRCCKEDLQQRLGLAVDASAPLIGIVSRLTSQKGIDLVIETWERLLGMGAQLAVLGTGDPEQEAALCARAADHAGRCAVRIGYDEALAHRIIAGADLFLMPSRYEPCGLTQLYALRYGTVPVAARTGGLVDTVIDADATPRGRSADGFLFEPGATEALLRGVGRALAAFHDREAWSRLRAAGMKREFGWQQSARRYIDLYEHALSDRARSIGE